jgi:hypothetical protein
MLKNAKMIGLATLVAAATIGGSASPALAGDRLFVPVVVQNMGPAQPYSASGSVSAAYNSVDGNQVILCKQSVYAFGYSFGYCWAVDANGNSATCFTANATMLAVMGTVNDGSIIEFGADAGSTDCSFLSVKNGSLTDPKAQSK